MLRAFQEYRTVTDGGLLVYGTVCSVICVLWGHVMGWVADNDRIPLGNLAGNFFGLAAGKLRHGRGSCRIGEGPRE